MGTWGAGVLDGDLGKDIEAAFVALLAEGLTSATATRQLEREYTDEIGDSDDGPSFWLALAAVQHAHGVLAARVKGRALAVIDRGEGLAGWSDDAKALRARRAELAALRARLEAPMKVPARAARSPKKPRRETSFVPGMLLGFTLLDGRRSVLWVTEIFTDHGARYPVVDVLAWFGPRFPPPKQLAGAPVWMIGRGRRSLRYIMTGEGESTFPSSRVEVLPTRRAPPPRELVMGATLCSWTELDESLLVIEKSSPFAKPLAKGVGAVTREPVKKK